MTKSLLKTTSLPLADDGRANNAINGNDAEFLSASKMLMAFGAEISWGSRNEDSRKIDLIASFDHPWFDKERLILLIQVKSGSSFGESTREGFILYASAIKLAQRTTHAICMIWVDRKSGKPFWAYVHPSTLKKAQEYGRNHSISPAMRYDLAQCQATSLPMKVGGSGVIISESIFDLPKRRKGALEIYKMLSKKGVLCPILGKVEFTRIGWRHMFRKTRSKNNKSTSLNLIGYIEKILLDIPSKHFITAIHQSTQSNYEYRNAEYVLIYDKVKYFNPATRVTGHIEVVARIIEEVRYPEEWANQGSLSQLIGRRVVLLSCYYKIK